MLFRYFSHHHLHIHSWSLSKLHCKTLKLKQDLLLLVNESFTINTEEMWVTSCNMKQRNHLSSGQTNNPITSAVMPQGWMDQKGMWCFEASAVVWLRFVLSSVQQRLVVQLDLLSWFECRHPRIWAAGTSERIAEITLPWKRDIFLKNSLQHSRQNHKKRQHVLTLPQADFGIFVVFFPLLSSSSSSARPQELHKHTQHIMSCQLWRIFKAQVKVTIDLVWWTDQFLQAFFFLPAPSPQVGALREAGSGFFKSSSSSRASESSRSWRDKVCSINAGSIRNYVWGSTQGQEEIDLSLPSCPHSTVFSEHLY